MLGDEFHATPDEPEAVAPSPQGLAYFREAKAYLALSRGVPLCPDEFLVAAGCHRSLIEGEGS